MDSKKYTQRLKIKDYKHLKKNLQGTNRKTQSIQLFIAFCKNRYLSDVNACRWIQCLWKTVKETGNLGCLWEKQYGGGQEGTFYTFRIASSIKEQTN